MHMLIATLIGLATLAVFTAAAGAINKAKATTPVNGPGMFLWLWLIACVIHAYIGVAVAGYSLGSELAVHAVIFGVPALAAWYLIRRDRQRNPR